MSYRDYFNIDPEYFPQVDKKIIDTQPDLWKKFYPHPSFVDILKATVDVLKRKKKLSVWVDGAYGQKASVSNVLLSTGASSDYAKMVKAKVTSSETDKFDLTV